MATAGTAAAVTKTSNLARHGEEAWAEDSVHAFSHWGGTILWRNYGKPKPFIFFFTNFSELFKIEVFFLPPYAPEYNPDEYLNHAWSSFI